MGGRRGRRVLAGGLLILWTIVSVTIAALILGGLFYCWGWEDGKNSADDEPERFAVEKLGTGMWPPPPPSPFKPANPTYYEGSSP